MPWQEHRSRTGSMLCYPLEETRLKGSSKKAWNQWPVLTQPKLNGERCRFVNGLLLSSTEQVIYSVPHINEALKKYVEWCTSHKKPVFELDGELYVHGMDFEEIHSRVSRTENLHEDYASIEFHVFDIATDEPKFLQATRLSILGSFQPLFENSSIKIVPFQLAHSYEEMLEHFDFFLEQGYEGIIIRHPFASYKRSRSTMCLKFKPKKQDDYVIVGFNEETDKNGTPKNRLGTLTLASGSSGDTFSVYSGFDDFLRDELWKVKESLIGKTITAYYQCLTNTNHVPAFGRVSSKQLKLQWQLNENEKNSIHLPNS